MSHALARLRHAMKDELFVRGPDGMVPTPRAENLAAPVRAAIDGLREALEPDDFDVATAEMSFTIAVDNYAAIVLVPPIVASLSRIAPRVKLDFRPSGTLNLPDLLDRNELQLAVGSAEVAAERFTRKRLVQDQFVLVMRRDHPMSKETVIAKETLAAVPRLEISSAQFGGESAGTKRPGPIAVPSSALRYSRRHAYWRIPTSSPSSRSG